MREDVEPLRDIAGNVNVRNRRNIFSQPPERLRFGDYTSKFGQHTQAVPSGRGASSATEILTRRSAYHPSNVIGRHVEIFDALTEDNVRPAHDAEASLLKATVEKARAWEE